MNTTTLKNLPTDLFRHIVAGAGIPMAIRSLDLQPLHVNRAFCDMVGASEEAILKVSLRTTLSGETYELYRDTILPRLINGESWSGEYPLLRADGTGLQVWARFDPIRDEDERISLIFSTFVDATENLQLRERLLSSERYLHFLAESDTDILFRIGIPSGRVEYVTSAVAKITGYCPEAFYYSDSLLPSLFPEDRRGQQRRDWEAICQSNAAPRYRFSLRHRNGRLRWFESRVSIAYSEEGKPMALEGIATDMTARRNAERTFEQANQRLRFLADNMADTLWSTDESGVLTYVSPSCHTVLGRQNQELIGKRLETIFHRDYLAVVQRWFEECGLSSSGTYTIELPYSHPRNGSRWISVQGTIVRDDDGCTRMLGLFRDVTGQRKTLDKLYDNESRYRSLFEDSPISLWEEDLSQLKLYIDRLKSQGVTDFRAYLSVTPEAVTECCRLTRVIEVNRATIQMMETTDKESLLGALESILPREAYPAVIEVIANLAEGETSFASEVKCLTATGRQLWTMLHMSVPHKHRHTLDRALISLIDLTPRKQAEQALQESERRYRTLVDNSGEGVIVTQNGRAIFSNDAALQLLGTAELPSPTSRLLDFVHPLDRENLKKWLTLHPSATHYPQDLRVVTADNDVHWLTLARKGMLWQGAQATMYIISDVTAHKVLERELLLAHAEMEKRVTARTAELNSVNEQLTAEVAGHIATQELLDESRLSLKALLDASSDFICLLNQNMRVLAANAISSSRFNLDPQDLQGRHLPSLLPREAGSRLTRTGRDVIRRGTTTRYVETLFGRTYDNSIYPVRSESGSIQRMAFYSRDVTEQVRAEERIRSLTRRLFSAQETERQRIARDLHDNVAQDLSSALVAIESMETEESPKLGGMPISQVLRRCVASVRNIAYGLHPSGLDQLGLGPAVERMCDDFSTQHRVPVIFGSTGIDHLHFDFDAATNIYRIIQEALNNTGKHARAGRVTVRLVAAHPELIIRIEDDGAGFDIKAKQKEAAGDKRMGLRSIQERSRLLGGETTIHSVPGAGTKVMVKLPTAGCTR